MTESRRVQEQPSQGLSGGGPTPVGSGASMRFTVSCVDNYVRGDLYDRETAEETRQFLTAVAAEAVKAGIDRVLISVHSSRPLFRVERYGLSEFFEGVASRPAHRVAAVSDSFEGQLAQQYVVRLARQRRLNVRSFSSEDRAIAWLQS